MTLEKDLNLESIRETGYMRFLFEQIPQGHDPVRYQECLVNHLTDRGRYENSRQFLDGYLDWQNKMCGGRD